MNTKSIQKLSELCYYLRLYSAFVYFNDKQTHNNNKEIRKIFQ